MVLELLRISGVVCGGTGVVYGVSGCNSVVYGDGVVGGDGIGVVGDGGCVGAVCWCLQW